MIGVRLPSRGSHFVRTGMVRRLSVVAALIAACAGFGRPAALEAGAAPTTVDPFLAEDTDAPADDEIPPLPQIEPETKPETKPEATPKELVPRVTRDIKKTAPPKADSETLPEIDPPATRSTPARAPSLKDKNTPLGDKSGWRSKSLEPAGAREPGARKPAAGDPESARFERDNDPADLTEPLANIVIEGNKTIKTEEIMKLLKTRKGRVADPSQIKEDITTLVKKRWFFNVVTRVARTKEGPVLVFKVLERPMLEKVTYVGNKKFKEKKLAELTGLKAGGAYDIGANRESARRIENHYREKGYLHAKVELEKGNLPEEREVVFKIDEGPKVVVTKISFAGNKSFEGAILKQHVKTKKRLFWFFGGKYDPSTIPEDMQALRTYYQELGYFDVKVTYDEVISENRAHVHIKYNIEEGERYKIRNIEFVGNRVIPADKLREKMKIHENDHFNQRFVTIDRDKIEAQYGELGRIFATVESHPKTFEEPGFVDLVYLINEDQPYRFGPIHVHINGDHPHTKETAVLNRLTYKPGDLASKVKMKQSEQRLKNTQIFAGAMPGQNSGGDPPRITTVFPEGAPRRPPALARGQSGGAAVPKRPRKQPVVTPEPVEPAEEEPSIFRGQNFENDEPSGGFGFDEPQGILPADPMFPEDQPPAYIDTDVSVTETQTGKLSFGVGVNSNYGLLGNITLQENNFDLLRPPTSLRDIIDGTAWRGGGQQFRVEAAPGVYLSRYLASWTDPYFLEQDIMVGVSGSYFTRLIYNAGHTLWFETREGGTVRAGHQFTPLLSGTVALKAENVKITNPAVPTPFDISSRLGDNFLSTARASLIHDTRDSPFLPGTGHYLEGSYEQGIANFVFPKAEVQARQYFLLKERPDGGNRHIISLTGNVGWTGNETPFFERFYAGGFATFRGFYFYGVGPHVNGIPVGGFFQALGSLEYHFPVTADNTIQLVTFTDFGTVDNRVSLDAFRLSVGAGFRLTVPMLGPLPIGVDFAIPVLRQSFDQTQVISFSMNGFR